MQNSAIHHERSTNQTQKTIPANSNLTSHYSTLSLYRPEGHLSCNRPWVPPPNLFGGAFEAITIHPQAALDGGTHGFLFLAGHVLATPTADGRRSKKRAHINLRCPSVLKSRFVAKVVLSTTNAQSPPLKGDLAGCLFFGNPAITKRTSNLRH